MPNSIKTFLGASMILAPILGVVSAVAAPALKSDTGAMLAQIAQHSSRWYVYALFVTASSWLFVPAVVGIVVLLAERAPRVSLVAGALALLGVLVAIGDATTELMVWQMGSPAADRAQMVALSDRYDNAAGNSLLFTVGGLSLVVGFAILGIALWRLRCAPAWAALGVPVGAVVNIVGFSMSSNAIVIASNVVLLAAFAPIAARLLRTGPVHAAGALRPHATAT